jgi:hypothetical protein
MAMALAFALAAGESRADSDVPPSRGFQLALRTGVAVPLGQVSSTTAMSDAFSVQVPFILDIGGKPIPELFVGAFLGAALGGAAGQVDHACTQLNVSCLGAGFRGGVLVEYNLRPGDALNPWLGAGFGYEIGGSNGSNGLNTISNSYRGFEFGHLLGGLDFRLQDYFGIGPFLDAALGRYDYAQNQTNQGGYVSTLGGNLDAKSFHGWLILGVRAVLFP